MKSIVNIIVALATDSAFISGELFGRQRRLYPGPSGSTQNDLQI